MHESLADEENQCQQQCGFQKRPADLSGQRLDRLRKGWDQHQQGHDGQILKQQHTHDLATMRGIKLAPVGEKFREDRGG